MEKCATGPAAAEKETSGETKLYQTALREGCEDFKGASELEPTNACLRWRAATCFGGMGDVTRAWLELREIASYPERTAGTTKDNKVFIGQAAVERTKLENENAFLQFVRPNHVISVDVGEMRIPPTTTKGQMEVVPVRPGRYWVHVEYADRKAKDVSGLIEGKQRQLIDLEPLPEPSDEKKATTTRIKWLPAIAATVLVAAGGVSALIENGRARDAYQRYQNATDSAAITQARSDTETADGWRNVAVAVTITSAVAAVLAAATEVLSRPEEAGPPEARSNAAKTTVRASGGPAAAGAGLQVQF